MTLDRDTICSIVAHRAAGNGIRQTSRLLDLHRDTVMRWARAVGDGCARLLDGMFRDLSVYRLEIDELHSYIHTRQHRLKPAE